MTTPTKAKDEATVSRTTMPWKRDLKDPRRILAQDDELLAVAFGCTNGVGGASHAMLIVTAVNSHDRLLAALEAAVSDAANRRYPGSHDPPWVGEAIKILAAVGFRVRIANEREGE